MAPMRIVQFAELPAGAWNAFVAAAPAAWWWHRVEWLTYCPAYRPGSVNRSFAVLEGQGLVGIAPLIQEGEAFTMGGEPGAAPVISANTPADLIAEEVGRLAMACGVRRAAFRGSPEMCGVLADHHGYRDISWSTRCLDLTPDESTLWRGVRKGHRADIRKAARAYRLSHSCEETACDFAATYRELHQAAHGNPRPPETYTRQAEWAQAGHGVVVLAWTQEVRPVAAAYFIIDREQAYYASSATLVPDVMAAVVWHGILALKARGVRTLELGWNPRPGDSEKAVGISRFKHGFGGVDVPVSAVEWREACPPTCGA